MVALPLAIRCVHDYPCVHAHSCVQMHMCALVCMHVFELTFAGQRSASAFVCQVWCTLFFEAGLPLTLNSPFRLVWLASKTRVGLSTFLSLSPQSWDFKDVSPCLDFYMGAGKPHSTRLLHSRHFNGWTISFSLCLSFYGKFSLLLGWGSSLSGLCQPLILFREMKQPPKQCIF